MRIAFAAFLIVAPLGVVEAGEISPSYRGAWAMNGDCKQARQIIIGETTIKLVEPGRTRTLTDAEEAVFKGKTLINASLPAKGDDDALLAFSGQPVGETGELKLLIDAPGSDAGFSGAFTRCKRDGGPAPRFASNKPKWVTPKRIVLRTGSLAPRPVRSFAYPGRPTLLGGLY